MKETNSTIFRDRDFSDGPFMSLVISYGNQLLGKRYLNNAELGPSTNSSHLLVARPGLACTKHRRVIGWNFFSTTPHHGVEDVVMDAPPRGSSIFFCPEVFRNYFK